MITPRVVSIKVSTDEVGIGLETDSAVTTVVEVDETTTINVESTKAVSLVLEADKEAI